MLSSHHAIADLNSLQLAQVVDNSDPDGRGRIRVRIHVNQMECWAGVITSSAGQGYGTSFIPKKDETVVVAFVAGDFPLILGSIWSGQGSIPAEAEAHEDKYSITTPAGTVMIFDDADGPKMKVRTPAGNSVTITDSGGGEIEMKTSTNTVKLSSSGIEIQAATEIKLNAPMVTIDTSMMQVNAPMATYSGVVQCNTIIATSVVGASYTPGAGNIW
ncbi:MAG TPA: VgrG protein [Candidatus Tenderia sp.]|nr:VgrG protein [Candidatus Tenderia sp.]